MSSARSPYSVVVEATSELNSYRAISPWAVLSFVLGLLSVTSVAPWPMFKWLFPPAAVVVAVIALRQISAAPRERAGARLAKLGLALAVVFWAVAVAKNAYWESWVRGSSRAIGDRFVEKLKAGDLESAFWLTLPKFARQTITEMPADKLPREVLERYMGFRKDKRELAEGLERGEYSVEFEEYEATAEEQMGEVALLVYKVHSPKGDTHLLLIAACVRNPESRQSFWFIREARTDYTPNSYQSAEAPHGHGH